MELVEVRLQWPELTAAVRLCQHYTHMDARIQSTDGHKPTCHKIQLQVNSNTHTRPLSSHLSGTTQVSRYQKGKLSGLCWSNRQCVAVASAGLYASLHLAPDRQPRQHLTTQFFTGWMTFLPPNQQRQSTEGSASQQQVGQKSLCPERHTQSPKCMHTCRIGQIHRRTVVRNVMPPASSIGWAEA